MKKIEIQNVYKKIGKKNIVNGITATINEGEVFGLLGPNGAGKTTLIKMIMGLMTISEGKIIIDGKDIDKEHIEAISNIRGLIEQPALYPHLSGYDNLKIFAKLDKVDEERIKEVTELVGLTNDIKRKAKEYSLGMRQRLAIGIALLAKPKILILDEPTNGLDPEGIMELRLYLQKIAKENKVAIIVSSHILAEMNLLCERFAIMKQGGLLKVVNKSEIAFNEDQFRVFIEVNKPEEAYNLLKEKYSVELKDNGIILELHREEIPKININLVNNDIWVYGISIMENPLEKLYFDIINETEEKKSND